MQEEWRPVKGYEGLYEVSNKGRVKSLERYAMVRGGIRVVRERILKCGIRSGYYYVSFSKNSKLKSRDVHELVCKAFLGERPKGHDVCHRDGVKTNNCLENLRYDSKSNNVQDMKLNGTWRLRETSGNHKLTELQVQEIYLLLNNTKLTYDKIGEMYGVCKSNIYCINNGMSWHLDSIKYPIR